MPGSQPPPPPNGPVWPGAAGQPTPPGQPTAARPGPWAQGGPQGGPPSGPPAGPPAPPQGPYGGPPPGGYPYGPQPPRRRTPWGWIVGGLTALVLVIALAIGGWAYGTGRLGIGPLSSQDKAAASVIAKGVGGPRWASADQRSCAATELMKDRRSKALEDSGVIESGGSDGWTYTGTWDAADADEFADDLLDCSADWTKQLGREWGLDDTGCLDSVGRSAVADTLVTSFGGDSGDATNAKRDAAAKLDACYHTGVANPTAKATPAYRAVDFAFTLPNTSNASTSLSVRTPDGSIAKVAGAHYRADAGQGGQQVCVQATLKAHYGWGSTSSGSTRACGTSKAKGFYWSRLAKCTDGSDCTTWALHANGFKSFSTLRVTFSDNGGDCNFTKHACTVPLAVNGDGRGFTGKDILFRYTTPNGFTDHYTATTKGLTAVIPD